MTLDEASCSWARVFGGAASQGSTGGALGHRANTWNVQVGGQRQVAPGWQLSGTLAYERLRCELAANGAGRSCEVAHTVFDQRGQVLAQVTARPAGPAGAIAPAVQVGTNATVAEPLRLGVENEAGLALPFRRCLARGCFAGAQPAPAEIAALLPRSEPARIEFRDGDGQPVALPLSLRGLATALDALRATGP